MNAVKPRLRLKRDAEWGEWLVVWYDFDEKKGFVRNEDKTYHTDDRDDAVGTMAHMQKQIDEEN